MTRSSSEHLAAVGGRPWIETVSGKVFSPDAPRFDIEDIAHALGNQCRFTGQCRFFYSVAEHSLLVAHLCERFKWADPLEGLLHDAHEAYVSDIASPWKVMLPDYKQFEKTVEAQMRAAFNLLREMPQGVKLADYVALMLEAKMLLPSKGATWNVPAEIRQTAGLVGPISINGFMPHIAKDHFMAAYNELAGPRGL